MRVRRENRHLEALQAFRQLRNYLRVRNVKYMADNTEGFKPDEEYMEIDEDLDIEKDLVDIFKEGSM